MQKAKAFARIFYIQSFKFEFNEVLEAKPFLKKGSALQKTLKIGIGEHNKAKVAVPKHRRAPGSCRRRNKPENEQAHFRVYSRNALAFAF